MSTRLEVLEAEALKLTDSERASLAQKLLASLDENSEVEEAWAAEVERRLAAVERGEVFDIPIAEALALLRSEPK
jgi:putative addiction module component (TIGR02574 family)